MDLERVRVKLEVARARLSRPFWEIPTGREYDSLPDDADELAYDALEKAYNSAFSVPTRARAIVSQRTHDADLPFHHDAQPRYVLFADISMGKTETMTKVVLPGLKEELAVWKAEHLSVPEELLTAAIVPSTATSFESIQSPGDLAEARNEVTPIAAVVTQFATHPAAPPQSPSPVRTRTSSEDALLSTPEAKKESPRAHLVTMNPQMVRKSSAGRDDHESLNEFLVAELQAYCSRLLNRGPPKKGPSGASDLAQITALQLHQDHQRALMDFDDEWKR
ncbi:hypothetical protein BBJ28_00023538 [Nothophytophthora sp. Chile5]|nr:hypothetical protein BBJ28_00023538 [Nothophytophthora sp. Chile5]